MFLLNRLPTKAVDGKTPFKAWYGFKPNMKNLKIFGCLCSTHVPNIKRDKLDNKAESSIFIGYNTLSKAYRIFQPQFGKILIIKNVVFMEDEAWVWNLENEIGKAPINLQPNENDVDDQPVRGTISLEDIYARCNVAVIKPVGFQEAMQDKKWLLSMEEELSMIKKNHTWQLVQKPLDRKVIGVKWVFKTKFNVDGSVN